MWTACGLLFCSHENMCKIDKKIKIISTPAIEKIQEKHLKKIPK